MRATLYTVLFLSLLAGCQLTAAAQGPFIAPACRRNCSPTDAACIASEQTCQGKLALYYGYMGQLGAGVTLYQLPQLYIDLLQPHYQGASLSGWRFGFGDRQPPNNATTDCTKTYFNDRAFVDKLRPGNLEDNSEFLWLLHELQHYVQCARLGGRDLYAKMWFDQLETTFIQNSNLATLHDRMPMEGEADTVANTVSGAIASLRGNDGRLVRPITLELLRNNQVIPTSGPVPHISQAPQTITARVTGFSSPPPIAWSIKRPNQVFAPANGSGPNGTELQWTPDEAGTHQIRATVNPASATQSLTRGVAFNVLAPGQQPPGTPPPQDVYETPTLVPKLQQVRLVVTVQRGGQPASSPVNICVMDNETQEVYARALIQRGQGNFTVRKNRATKI
ncbi:MAG: hypothetical protein LC776_03490, partial [Acidobacteria bacterium]|nr:hypothetical protein [Acidobacteriota bacterium]